MTLDHTKPTIPDTDVSRSSDLGSSCPGDDRCICRAWITAAKTGIKNGVFFDALRLIGSDKWRATGVRTDTKLTIYGEGGSPAEALRALDQAILRDRMERHDG